MLEKIDERLIDQGMNEGYKKARQKKLDMADSYKFIRAYTEKYIRDNINNIINSEKLNYETEIDEELEELLIEYLVSLLEEEMPNEISRLEILLKCKV
jgi:uncharacterized membrane protein YheB (UPF0754 family)